MAEKRRQCTNCLKNRAERFYTSARAGQCVTCARKKGALRTRGQRLVDTYDITEAEYKELYEAQGGCCAICGGHRSYNLDVDHDHALVPLVGVRGSVRGLLCKTCNRRLLRAARDSIEILYAAIDYLKYPPAQRVLLPKTAG